MLFPNSPFGYNHCIMRRSFLVLLLLAGPALAQPRLPQVEIKGQADLNSLLPRRSPIVTLEATPGREPADRYISQPMPFGYMYGFGPWGPAIFPAIFPADPRLPQATDPFWYGSMPSPADLPYRL
jgi:hypothetical protein